MARFERLVQLIVLVIKCAPLERFRRQSESRPDARSRRITTCDDVAMLILGMRAAWAGGRSNVRQIRLVGLHGVVRRAYELTREAGSMTGRGPFLYLSISPRRRISGCSTPPLSTALCYEPSLILSRCGVRVLPRLGTSRRWYALRGTRPMNVSTSLAGHYLLPRYTFEIGSATDSACLDLLGIVTAESLASVTIGNFISCCRTQD